MSIDHCSCVDQTTGTESLITWAGVNYSFCGPANTSVVPVAVFFPCLPLCLLDFFFLSPAVAWFHCNLCRFDSYLIFLSLQKRQKHIPYFFNIPADAGLVFVPVYAYPTITQPLSCSLVLQAVSLSSMQKSKCYSFPLLIPGWPCLTKRSDFIKGVVSSPEGSPVLWLRKRIQSFMGRWASGCRKAQVSSTD